MEKIKLSLDIAAAGTTVGVLAQLLPVIASLFTIMWTGLRITEMVTGKTIHELLTKK